MNRWLKLLLSIVVALALVVAGIFLLRAVNEYRYYAPSATTQDDHPNIDLRDPKTYPLDRISGVTITPITGEHMAGFHFKPHTITRPGVTISYGGSEGGAGWGPAAQAASLGQESLALFFWGQPNQTPALDEVPLDDFQEVLDWVDTNIETPTPIIAAGGSKGAEYVANLLPRFPQINHAILIAPASYSFPALGNQQDHSSWSYAGKPLPFLAWDSNPDASGAFMGRIWKFWVNVPVQFGDLYDMLLVNPADAARIRIDDSNATIHAFAGEEDALWPSAKMAKQLKAFSPDQVTVTTYPGVGHMPGLPRYSLGLDLGGSDQANMAAKEGFERDIRDQISAWAPETD